jgi:predicted Zn-dependent protease
LIAIHPGSTILGLAVASAVDRFIRRETRILAVLSLIAVAGFFASRAIASFNRRNAHQDAARWHALGAARLAEGRPHDAVDAFRAASLIDRDDRGHRLALADALRRTGDNTSALDVLLRLRESLPEDVEVNARLARLEAAAGNLENAVRYYQAAVLALWRPARIEERRALRTELIEFLLSRGATERALAETLELSGEIPDQPSAHVRVGQLLLRAGSPQRALEQFNAVLRSDPRNRAASDGRREAFDVLAAQPRPEPR